LVRYITELLPWKSKNKIGKNGGNMVLNIILWVLFGALAGWLASIVMRTNAEEGAVANIVVGIVGALIGGWLYRAVTGNSFDTFSLGGLLIAILGAVILTAVLKMFGVFGGRGIGSRV
jgi:uncharacterized membrane protein YeaQ/YmgE (transglycosylase-associated protein family)